MTTPLLGAQVTYRLAAADAAAIDNLYPMPPFGTQTRNPVATGEVHPATVVNVHGDGTLNLQVILDGMGNYWVTDRAQGSGVGTWT